MRPALFFLLFIVSPLIYAFDHSHQSYDKLLSAIVTEKGPQSFVDYDHLKNNPHELNAYLKQIEAVTKDEFEQWNEQQQLAFLINAYNAFTLKLILNNYPDIKSILDLGGLIISSPWKKKFFTLFGKKSFLAYIEDDLLRENYKEPRIHFAINCASKGCPALQKKAYVANNLEQQLEKASLQFMRDSNVTVTTQTKNDLRFHRSLNGLMVTLQSPVHYKITSPPIFLMFPRYKCY